MSNRQFSALLVFILALAALLAWKALPAPDTRVILNPQEWNCTSHHKETIVRGHEFIICDQYSRLK